MSIDTYEEYELIRDGLIMGLNPEQRDIYNKLKLRLKSRETIRNSTPNDKSSHTEYHFAYNQLTDFEEKHGFIEVAKEYAGTQAKKFGFSTAMGNKLLAQRKLVK